MLAAESVWRRGRTSIKMIPALSLKAINALGWPGPLSGCGPAGVFSSGASPPSGEMVARSLGLLAKGMAVPWDSLWALPSSLANTLLFTGI